MDSFGQILTSVGSLLVAIGTLVVLLRIGGVVEALAGCLIRRSAPESNPGAEPEE